MITHIRVKNFKSLNDISLRLGRRNVLVGPNMAGKSNLISVFRFLTQMVTSTPGTYGLPNAINSNGGFAELAWRGSESNLMSLALEGEFDQLSTEGEKTSWKYSLDILGDRSRGTIMVQGESLTISIAAGDIALIQKVSNSSIRSLFSPLQKRAITFVQDSTRSALEYELPDWEGNQLRRLFASTCFYRLIPQLMKQINPVAAPKFLDEGGANLSSWLMMIQTRFPESYSRIISAVKDVLPDVGNIVTWPTPQSTVFIASSERFLQTPVPVWQMSDGELAFIALLSLIFSPDECGAPIYCIEELENHLHPRLIEALIELHAQRQRELKDQASQVIITTHSPQVIDKLDIDDLIVVAKRNGETVFTRPGDKAHLRQLLQDEEMGLGDLYYSGALSEE